MHAATQRPVIVSLVAQHADEAGALWLRRDEAVRAVDYSLRDLADVDDRLDANLQGLRCAGDVGLRACNALLASGQPGDLFAPTVLALENDDTARLDALLAIAEAAPSMARALISAFGWVSPQYLTGVVAMMLASSSAFARRVALASCAVHRVSPGAALREACVDADLAVRERAFRTAGELGAVTLLPIIAAGLGRQPEGGDGFWAASSMVLLGDRGDGLDHLAEICLDPGARRARALQLALPALGLAGARSLLRRLAARVGDERLLVLATGWSGDPHYVPWLIAQLGRPQTVALAGEAIVMITGAKLVLERLTTAPAMGELDAEPVGDSTALTEPMLAGEAYLPKADAEKVTAWWTRQRHRFVEPKAYLLGEPAEAAQCIGVLRSATQHRRIAAAHRLALLEPGRAMFEWRAPAWRQVHALLPVIA